MQIKRPFPCEVADVVIGFGVFEPTVEEHHWHIRSDPPHEVEDDQRILAPGEREIPVMAV